MPKLIDTSIRINSLHEECANQPVLYGQAAEEAAEAKAEMHRAKLTLDEVRSEVDMNVRAKPESFGISKVTEAAISSAVTLDASVHNAENLYLDTQEIYDRAMVLVNAFEHRRSMLNNEVQLYVNNYWGQAQEEPVSTTAMDVAERKTTIKDIMALRRDRVEKQRLDE